MVTSTIYSNSQIVVIDIGSVPATVPWLEQTTYLIDQSGHTTAVLAQTDQPTGGVILSPVPYTAPAQIALPSATAGDLPSGWAYRGCYIDVPKNHTLPMQQPDNSNLNVQSCVRSCYQLGYSISGLEFRKQCYCGNAIYNGGHLAPQDSQCNLPCSGNAKEVCGAGNRLSIYSNGTLATYQAAAVQTSRPTTTALAVAPSLTGAALRTPIPATVTAAVIGALAVIAITVALVCYLRRRIRSDRLRTKSLPQISQVTARPWPPADCVPSWEEFVKEAEEYYVGFDESTMLSSEGNGSGLGLKSTQVGYRPSNPELRERYEQLRCKNQQLFHTGLRSSNTSVELPVRYSPPTGAPAQAHLGQPTSILKRPAPPKPRTWPKACLTMGTTEVLGVFLPPGT